MKRQRAFRRLIFYGHPTRLALRFPRDFEEVYGKLLHFARGFPFDPDNQDCLIHMTTGTHVAQICLFRLAEARYLPGRLLQTQPPRGTPQPVGTWGVIDLDLSRYDSIATRFAEASAESASFLKNGIETRNAAFKRMIDEIEQVALRNRAPILLMRPTGAGKGQLTSKIYELKKLRHQIGGAFVEVTCLRVSTCGRSAFRAWPNAARISPPTSTMSSSDSPNARERW